MLIGLPYHSFILRRASYETFLPPTATVSARVYMELVYGAATLAPINFRGYRRFRSVRHFQDVFAQVLYYEFQGTGYTDF